MRVLAFLLMLLSTPVWAQSNPSSQGFTFLGNTTAPPYTAPFTMWMDTSVSPYTLRLFDGTSSVALGTLNPTTHAWASGAVLPSATTQQLYGGTGSAGAAQAISLGSGLIMTGNTLSATGGGGGGGVTTSGSPSAGNLTVFSGVSVITNGNLSGDVTTSGSLVTTVGKVNGVSFGSSPSTNTVPVVTGANTITYQTVPNAALANPSTTVNGQVCTLGSTCTISASAGSITVGTTGVLSGTTTRVLYDNAGTLGELAVTGSGNVVMSTSPTLTTPALGTPSALVLTNATGLPNAGLVNAATTVNGQSCTLGSTCTVTAAATGVTIGSTTVTSGTSSRLIYDNTTLGEAAGLTFDGTSIVTLGVAGTSVGGVALQNATSGTLTIKPPTGALGTVTVTVPAATDTLVNLTGSQTLTNKTLTSPTLTTPALGTPSALVLTNATGLPNAGLVNAATTVNGQSCTLGSTCTVTAAATGITVGSTSVTSGTSSRVLYDNTTVGEAAGFTFDGTSVLTLGVAGTSVGGVALKNATSGTLTLNPPTGALGTVTVTIPAATDTLVNLTGSQTLTNKTLTSPTLTTPALGTPASGTMTNVTGVPISALTGTITNAKCVTWDSTTAVTAQTISFPVEWATYTITSVKSSVTGGGSFTANVKIASTSVTSCSAISVSGATNTSTSCTAANTGVVNDIINIVISAPSGTVNQAYVCPVFTHSVN